MVFAKMSGWIDIIELKDGKRSSKASEQPSRADLEQAAALFDEHGVNHGVITRLPSFGIDVLSFKDPDGIQLELTAPVADQA